MKKKLLYIPLFAILVFIDQWTKNWISLNLKGHENIVWIKNIFELEYVENTGAAFSSFSGKQAFLLTFTFFILVIALIEFIRIPVEKRFVPLSIAFVLLLSGAVGNMIDRFFNHYVVDFFYFVPINFPRFNVADICVCVSVALFIILFVFVYKDEETDFLFHFKKK